MTAVCNKPGYSAHQAIVAPGNSMASHWLTNHNGSHRGYNAHFVAITWQPVLGAHRPSCALPPWR